jgi:Fic family protein
VILTNKDMFNPTKPYYDLPLLPPGQTLESIELFKTLVPAAEALAALSATAEHLPNQAALYQSVVLLEAKASSEMEQVVTTDGKLFGSESSRKAIDPMTKEVHRYAEAIHHGWRAKKPLCTNVMEEICTIIRNKPVKVRKVPGTALKNASGQIVYTPPDGEKLLRDLLDNLFKWMTSDDQIHPIIKAAIAHYQFESIHPFTDGNGRTGRIMVVLYLVEQKLLKAPVLFLSGEILKNREMYYSLLQSTHESNDFFPYLIWFIKLIYRASLRSTIRANKVRIAMLKLKNTIRKLDPHMYSQDLVNILFRGPIVFANDLVGHGIAGSLSTAHAYLKKMESAGLLFRSQERYTRKVGYVNGSLLDALSGEIDLS